MIMQPEKDLESLRWCFHRRIGRTGDGRLPNDRILLLTSESGRAANVSLLSVPGWLRFVVCERLVLMISRFMSLYLLLGGR